MLEKKKYPEKCFDLQPGGYDCLRDSDDITCICLEKLTLTGKISLWILSGTL